jgi:Flp pilus assembly protein TadD
VTHANLGRFDEAFKAFDDAIRLDPKDAIPYADRGLTLGKLGRFDKALDDLAETRASRA